MSLEQQLRDQLTQAIKARDLRTADVIRMLNSKVTERRTAKDFKGVVDDELYLDVIASYRKTLEKAKAEYEKLGERGRDQAAELDFEIAVCSRFLPQPLGADEVRDRVRAIIAELGGKNPKLAGRVVGMLMKEHKGRVDAQQVKQIVDDELAS
jgi:hypothetical protein